MMSESEWWIGSTVNLASYVKVRQEPVGAEGQPVTVGDRDQKKAIGWGWG